MITHLLPTIEFSNFIQQTVINLSEPESWMKSWNILNNYTSFISQKMKLSMFIPCDENGNPIDPPMDYDYLPDIANHIGTKTKYPQEQYIMDLELYAIAESNVLFKDWKFAWESHSTIIINDNKNNCLEYFPKTQDFRLDGYDDIEFFYNKLEWIAYLIKLELTDAAKNIIFKN